MSIVIVGGHDRMCTRYKEICKKHGCKCKVFTQCPADFRNQLGSPDVIMVLTGTMAHKMLNVAKSCAEKSGARMLHCNSSSASALNEALSNYLANAM